MGDPEPNVPFSLLYPPERPRPSVREALGENAVQDLALDEIAWALSIQNKYHDAILSLLLELCDDPQVITYRQDVLADFVDYPRLADRLRALLPTLAKLRDMAESRSHATPLQETFGRLAELNTYVTCVRDLQAALRDPRSAHHSTGLAALRDHLERTAADPAFQSLEQELPKLLARFNRIPSITIGVNLDAELLPVEATLLAVHDKPFKGGGTLLDHLMGTLTGKKTGRKPHQGIGPLHSVPYEQSGSLDGRIVPLQTRANPLLVPLFRDLHEVLRAVITPVTAALKQFAQVQASLLLPLEAEIAFYLGAAALVRRMQAAGLPVCRPRVLPAAQRACRIKAGYNLVLALHLTDEDPEARLDKTIILNEVEFGPRGRIFILTGPNQGGKTIYTQAVGIAQVLFQAGLCLPAREARMSPVDGIHTHFAALEASEPGAGRLGEEARRLSAIFQKVTAQSLVLLNESLSSTSPGESLYLARDVVRALRLFEVRAVFATHLHELAEGLDEIHAQVAGDSRVVSLVAGIALKGEKAEASEDLPRTFRIKPGPPRGLSYARGIANRYGISFEQLAGQRQARADGG